MMDKTVSISKEQYIAGLNLAAYMMGKTESLVPLRDILMEFSKEIGPYLKEDWTAKVTMQDYENIEFSGDKNE